MIDHAAFVVVFSGNDVVEAAHTNPSYDYDLETFTSSWPNTEVAAGDATIVTCSFGNVGGNRIGIDGFEARRASLTKPLPVCDICLVHRPDSPLPSAIASERIGIDELSNEQRSSVVDAIASDYPYWWEHATREAKAAMQQAYSNNDEARELVREGGELSSRGHYRAAKKMIERGLSIYPEMDGARNELGRIAIKQGDVEGAIHWFNEELNCAGSPRELDAHSYLAAIYQARGDSARADRHASAAMETKAYQNTPSTLAPEVVEEIRHAVRMNGDATPQREHLGRSPNKPWWKFW